LLGCTATGPRLFFPRPQVDGVLVDGTRAARRMYTCSLCVNRLPGFPEGSYVRWVHSQRRSRRRAVPKLRAQFCAWPVVLPLRLRRSLTQAPPWGRGFLSPCAEAPLARRLTRSRRPKGDVRPRHPAPWLNPWPPQPEPQTAWRRVQALLGPTAQNAGSGADNRAAPRAAQAGLRTLSDATLARPDAAKPDAALRPLAWRR
jgi:hypothetical protein